jgi:hypothetical protein
MALQSRVSAMQGEELWSHSPQHIPNVLALVMAAAENTMGILESTTSNKLFTKQ